MTGLDCREFKAVPANSSMGPSSGSLAMGFPASCICESIKKLRRRRTVHPADKPSTMTSLRFHSGDVTRRISKRPGSRFDVGLTLFLALPATTHRVETVTTCCMGARALPTRKPSCDGRHEAPVTQRDVPRFVAAWTADVAGGLDVTLSASCRIVGNLSPFGIAARSNTEQVA